MEIIFYISGKKARSLLLFSITKPVGRQICPDLANGEQFGNPMKEGLHILMTVTPLPDSLPENSCMRVLGGGTKKAHYSISNYAESKNLNSVSTRRYT